MTQDAVLYCEVVQFYARQMSLMEEGRVAEYAATFTEDGVFEHSLGWRLEGRQQIIDGTLGGLEHYAGKAMRHWFNRYVVEQEPDGTVRTSCLAMVSVVDQDGQVTFEPTCTVSDVLVRENGALLTRSRFLQHDTADLTRVWEGRLADSGATASAGTEQ
ncbi:nuclear transport factor 2 family protein [Streptomyces sp. E11-3]|uniref:nuclear transport factor 2 family protein n=1 Tax=Streptomyces sp. E11-3 TaxID=3110112 RepID=UPI003980EF85